MVFSRRRMRSAYGVWLVYVVILVLFMGNVKRVGMKEEEGVIVCLVIVFIMSFLEFIF